MGSFQSTYFLYLNDFLFPFLWLKALIKHQFSDKGGFLFYFIYIYKRWCKYSGHFDGLRVVLSFRHVTNHIRARVS